ncbi:MAG: bifunctional demethylmenaquinone methyltransferase/2-methoxy-6-polyprenyl-1,4-benzoquinol methylase UbiE [Actinobacteria bacterium]|nr:MAG: bifunctional demethylmenaquinone methyltransferase/2-methoxy-6-polyprenyl-1,4-benzoquinol methylase UbiE [Actinomycetota bacterium]
MTETDSVRRADLNKIPEHVSSMFDHVASRYDLMNTLLTGGMDHVWLAALRKAVAPTSSEVILDLAAGTGASSAALAVSGAKVIACDLSKGMIEVGRERHPELEFVHGDATALEFDDNSFDAVTISYGLRNVVDTQAALREMLRVTRPGGRLVVCEFSTPTNPLFRSAYRFHLGRVVPALAQCASSDDVAYDYLAESILAWPDQETLGRLIAHCGWRNVEYRNLTGGIVALHRAFKAH